MGLKNKWNHTPPEEFQQFNYLALGENLVPDRRERERTVEWY